MYIAKNIPWSILKLVAFKVDGTKESLNYGIVSDEKRPRGSTRSQNQALCARKAHREQKRKENNPRAGFEPEEDNVPMAKVSLMN